MSRQLRSAWRHGDLADVEGYVRKVVARIAVKPGLFEEAVGAGLVYAGVRAAELGPDPQGFKAALDERLEGFIRDHLRSEYRWARRAAPLEEAPDPAAARDEALVESRVDLAAFTSQADVHDPRLTGRYAGVPSWRVPGTQMSQEIWSLIEDERRQL
jgi:hypothetical protein